MRWNQKGFTAILFLVGLVLVLGIGAGVYLVNQRTGFFTKARPTKDEKQTLNPGFKGISSQKCHISLQYPDNLQGEASDKDNGCLLAVKQQGESIYTFILATVQDNTWEQVVDNYKKAQNVGLYTVHDIKIAEVDGIKFSQTINSPSDYTKSSTLISDNTYFHKGNLVFQTICSYSPNDDKTKATCEHILSSIKFSGTAEDYNNISFKTDPKVKQGKIYDAKVKHDFFIIKIGINLYKQQNGVYPNTLQAIIDKGFLAVLPTNPYTNQSYSYQSDGNTYALSGGLSDGTPYQVTDKDSNP